MLTVAEEVVLLALDEDTGGGGTRLGLDWAVAGAVVVELALAERIAVGDDDVVTVVDPAPTGVGHLDTVLAEVAGRVKVSTLLRRTRGGAPGRAIASLVERGVLRRRRGRLLGLVPAHRYPTQDASARSEIRSRLADAVLDGREPDERTAALIGVLHAARLRRRALPTGHRRQVRTRMGDIAKGQAVGPAVRTAIARTKGAIAAMAASG
ncbi:GOLPH3/VPS74 family protein [Pseudonocardia abyssalis]|uniref:GPP34 family phosphoprotein n=1 Tax=Pseudonocardia abyssalis TaxID=2792008 RepID=A0ABS6USU1_9PSEU|nr:GPP34 family phosphoprotein [Pseudonocardia abyssalis]MBW0118583.1 GPP34 family phosphoprotein [Pseudonocardia abyssalis]MBW0135324.1 GPP34 family phosphoprotein [Pseudonocardia abyssalis]